MKEASPPYHGRTPWTAQRYHAFYVRQWRARIRGKRPPEHGTLNAYTNYSCRCPCCTAVKREHLRSWRARAAAGGRSSRLAGVAPPVPG